MPRLQLDNKQQRDEIRRQMMQMYEDDKTYQEIGDAFGISRQRVFQMIGAGNPKRFRKITPLQCIYKGIRKFMNDNKISLNEMTRRVYGNTTPGNYQHTRKRLNGDIEISKTHIDKLLSITGLTYEAAFELESEV